MTNAWLNWMMRWKTMYRGKPLAGIGTTALLAMFFFITELHADPHQPIVEAARSQIGKTLRYDPSYVQIPYPGGDVPIKGGVCTDVVIRALRKALGLDLQQLVHEDMTDNFHFYPKRWGLAAPDQNIDHRRVPNLRTYFTRQGWELDLATDPSAFKPGDIVTCIVPLNRPHIMIVSDARNGNDRPLVIHNIGAGTREEDRLFEFKLTGHYRVKQ